MLRLAVVFVAIVVALNFAWVSFHAEPDLSSVEAEQAREDASDEDVTYDIVTDEPPIEDPVIAAQPSPMETLARRIKTARPYTQPWWQAKHDVIAIQIQQGKIKNAKGLLENLRLVSPTLGGRVMRAKFARLAKSVGLVSGW